MDSQESKNRSSRRAAFLSVTDMKWTCGVCTYQNNAGKPKCDMCQTPKGTSSRKNIHRKDALSEQQLELNRIKQANDREETKVAAAAKRPRETTPVSPASESKKSPSSHQSKAKAVSTLVVNKKEKQENFPGPPIVQRALKKLKAVDVRKTDVTVNASTVSIWAFKSAAPTFGFNLPSD
eukprot:m.263228 g.263228  ORF g.263228 m.263228 type:complete len:179 (+) comp49360_c0_seq1:493-1029(+)